MFKKVKILEFGDDFQNPREEYTEISTNMPGIDSLIREIDVNISET